MYYAHGGKQRKMTLVAEEFIRRFLRHVLPKGLVRIRYDGWMANRCRRQCAAQCRALLAAQSVNASPPSVADAPSRRWPHCGGAVEVGEMIRPREVSRCRTLRRLLEPDTS